MRLRSLDRAGRVLEGTGVRVDNGTETSPEGGTFSGRVPAAATALQLVRGGAVLHRLERTRPPRVRLLAPRRRSRARGSLPVRWSASDPDGGPLTATVDYSADGGRSWRTSSTAQAAAARESRAATSRAAGARASA